MSDASHDTPGVFAQPANTRYCPVIVPVGTAQRSRLIRPPVTSVHVGEAEPGLVRLGTVTMALAGGVGLERRARGCVANEGRRANDARCLGKGNDPVTGSRQDDTRLDAGSAYFSSSESVAVLDRELEDTAYGQLDFSDELRVTEQDVLAALGPDADMLMSEIDVDVDELIRLINAETTMLPPLVLPDEVEQDRTASPQAKKAAVEEGLREATKTWKRRFLKGAVLSLLVTVSGGGAAALAMNKSITVDVDGHQQTVHSYGGTVGEVLKDAGLSVGEHDALSPSPQAAVGDGGVIKLERGRQLNLVVDGVSRPSWVRATTLGEAMNQLGMGSMLSQGAWTSMPSSGELPLEGSTVQVKTLKHITLFDGTNAPRQVSTNAVTTKELVSDLKLNLGPDDAIDGGLDVSLKNGAEVHVSRMGVSMVNQEETIDPEVQKVDDPTQLQGQQSVEDPGTPGKKLVTYKVTKKTARRSRASRSRRRFSSRPRPRSSRSAPRSRRPRRSATPACGTASRSASRAATGPSTPATATTAASSSTVRPGTPTAAASTPPRPTRPPASSRSRSPRRCATPAAATAPGVAATRPDPH